MHLQGQGQNSVRVKGYKGVQIEGVRILMPGQKRGITRTLKAMIKRRSAIEPGIDI